MEFYNEYKKVSTVMIKNQSLELNTVPVTNEWSRNDSSKVLYILDNAKYNMYMYKKYNINKTACLFRGHRLYEDNQSRKSYLKKKKKERKRKTRSTYE